MLRLPSSRGRQGPGAGASAGQADLAAGTLEITPMRRRHLRSVIAIEQQVFPSPWSVGLYLSELAQPATRAYFVAKVGGEVVGYGGMMLVVGEAHVTTIAVGPTWQRSGIGRRLLLRLAREARARNAQHLTLEVRVSNVGAQELYRQFGFAPAGIRKNYYAEVHEDALVMWAHDIDSDAYGQRLDEIEARLLRSPEGDPSGGPGGPEGVP